MNNPFDQFDHMAEQPRGVRNNNPLNLTSANWVGEIGADGRFAQFETPEAGRTAADQNLQAYYRKHGLKTVSGVISRWAPPSENDTPAYIDRVAAKLGVSPDAELNMEDSGVRSRLLDAMQEHETGQPASANPFDQFDGEAMPPESAGAVTGADAPSPALDVGHVEFISAPKTAAGNGSVVDATSGEALTEPQTRVYADMAKSGALDRNAPAGSEKFPLAQRRPDDLPGPGQWYVDVAGEVKQVPTDPWTKTGAAALTRLAVPTLGGILDLAGAPIKDDRFDAMTRGAQSGLLLGGRNELVAGLSNLPALVQGGVPLLADRFHNTLQKEDAASGKSRRDFPLAYDASAAAGAIGGGLALPAGATVASRVGVGGALGAGGGYVGTDGSAQDRLKGAALGGLLGGAAPVVLPALASKMADLTGAPLRSLADETVPMSPLTGLPMRSATPPKGELRAAEALRRALVDRDGDIPMVVGARAADEGKFPFQAGGDNLTGLAEVMAQSPGPGQRIIRDAVREQRAGVPGRVKGAVAETFGGTGDYFERLDQARAARSQAAASGMTRLADHLVTLDDDSVQALRSDLARSAVKEQALNALASADPEMRDAGARLNRLYDDLLDKPSAQTITVRDAQNISKSLLDAADAAYSSGNGARGKALKDLGKAVRTNAATPERGGFAEFGDWLQRYGEDSDAIDALELGRDVFSGRLDMSVERLRKAYAGWNDVAKENYRLGAGEALMNQVRRKGGVSEARELLKNEEFADRLRVAVPDDMSFSQFKIALEHEVTRADKNNRVVGGSPTYARQAARSDLEEQAADPLEMAAEVLDVGLSPLQLTGKALKEALKAVPKKDRSVISDPDANEALARALTDQDEMTRLLNLLERHRAARAVPLKQVSGRAGAAASSAIAQPQQR